MISFVKSLNANEKELVGEVLNHDGFKLLENSLKGRLLDCSAVSVRKEEPTQWEVGKYHGEYTELHRILVFFHTCKVDIKSESEG
jgi:hypothetical protein